MKALCSPKQRPLRQVGMKTASLTRCFLHLAILLTTLGCASGHQAPDTAELRWTIEAPVKAVNEAVPIVLNELGLVPMAHSFDGARGRATARNPAGAVVEIRFEVITRDRTSTHVSATRVYGEELVDLVILRLLDVAEELASASP